MSGKFGVNYEKGGGKTVYPVGFFQAVCSGVIDMGMQISNFEGKESKKHMCYLLFEFIDTENEPNENGSKIKTIAKRYSSLNFSTEGEKYKSGLQNDLESWQGHAFTDEEIQVLDLYNLYGANCTIVLEEKGKYVNVTKVMRMEKGKVKLLPERQFNDEPFEWIQKIKNKQVLEDEYKKTEQQPDTTQPGPESFADDIPF